MRPQVETGYDAFAEFYDAWHDRWPQNSKANCVEALAQLAGGHPVLELAVGTGRIAIPLAETGLRVSGIDSSVRMLERLRAKPGAGQISCIQGDFADVPAEGPFGLVYVVFSFGYLLTQAEQLRCFGNVAARLAPGGYFVIQTAMPGAGIFNPQRQIESLFDVPAADSSDSDSVLLLSSKADLVRQLIDQRFIVLGEAGTKIYAHQRRYVWPAELDLMARCSGLTLHARWGGWQKEAFTDRSPTQISAYRRPARDAAE